MHIRILKTALLTALTTGILTAADTSIEIDLNKQGPEVNPHMYGIFFEEINHGGDGGLYAELVRNRSFEDGNIPEGMVASNGFAVAKCRDKIPWPPKEPVPGWSLVQPGGAEGAMLPDTNKPLNAVQLHSLRIDARKAGVGVANEGYYGMSFAKGAIYNLSLYARSAQGYCGTLRAVLESKDGTAVSAPVTIKGIGANWQKLTAALTANAESNEGRLVLYADGPGTVWLDVVSLFPAKTFNNRPNGFRVDIAQMLKDLKPGFIRFPGGCITEGLTLEQGFEWKKTIGDIALRPGVWNAMWGYRRTDGFGYHEMLQLAEDTGAAALYCLNIGIACTIHAQGGVPCAESEIQRYVKDGVDAVSYANDPSTTEWGKIRAKNGHPDPFNLRYVNIGNELNCREYTERYPLFYNAIKTKYPDIVAIAYAPVGKPKAPVEMKDVHDYRDDKWFLDNMNRFDKYNRSEPKIANMEMAVRTQRNHTLHNGLLEAAYMIGLERNADVVRLVSYAPLLWNVNHKGAWEPDLIHFNNHQVYGTPSYYVQKVFMHNRPDTVLGTKIDGEASEGLYALAGREKASGAVIIKIVNLKGEERTVSIRISGAGSVGEATETVVTADDEMAKNSFEKPTNVADVTKPARISGATFTYKVPKYSLIALKLKVK